MQVSGTASVGVVGGTWSLHIVLWEMGVVAASVCSILRVGRNPHDDGVGAAMGGVEANVDGVETNFGGVVTDLYGVETHFGGVEANLSGVETNFGGVETSFDRVQAF